MVLEGVVLSDVKDKFHLISLTQDKKWKIKNARLIETERRPGVGRKAAGSVTCRRPLPAGRQVGLGVLRANLRSSHHKEARGDRVGAEVRPGRMVAGARARPPRPAPRTRTGVACQPRLGKAAGRKRKRSLVHTWVSAAV